MRRIRNVLILLAALALLLAPAVHAADLWSEDYYRAADSSGELTDAQQKELDEKCLAFMEAHHVDLALLAVGPEDHEDRTLSDLARGFYDDCGFGYGPDRDGFQMVWDRETGETIVEAYGAAAELVPQDYLDFVAESVPDYAADYGVFGPMYATTLLLSDYLDGTDPESAADPAPQREIDPEEIPRVGPGGDLPPWYPVSTEDFPFYHDPDAPRVVDTADIFSAEEEAAMEARLAEIRGQIDRDIVIVTDVSSYGLGEMIYSADFFDFNGYGCGDEYEGVCLFICMDPNDRGWWASCYGPVTRDLYTEGIANEIDDVLYEYMVAGRYYEGISDWIENFRRLYQTGSPFTPDWYSQADESFVRFHDGEAPRVVDDANLLTEEERQQLETRAGAISDAYGVDVVIHTAVSSGPLSKEEFSDLFYYYNGYGLGEDYDGILLTVFKRPGYSSTTRITASGVCTSVLSEVNEDRLRGHCESKLDEKAYFKALNQWLNHTEHMFRTGRVPRSAGYWVFVVLLSLAVGAAVGGASLAWAKKRMEVPAMKTNANGYLVKNSLSVEPVSDEFIRSVTTRTYDPVETKSSDSGSSSSGRSSYSSSYRGSSGRTHSGSGRKF